MSDDLYTRAYANEHAENARLRAEIKELKQASLLAGDRIICEACGCDYFRDLRFKRALFWRKAQLRANCGRCARQVSFAPGIVTSEYDHYLGYKLRWVS